MKKIIVILTLALFTSYFVGAQELASPTTTIVKLDSNQAGIDTVQIAQYLTLVNRWFAGCGADGLILFKQGKELGVNVKDIFKDLPLPTTQEGVAAWTNRISVVFGGLGSIVVALLTFALSLFKKNPEATISTVQALFNRIRTRYLLAFSALVVSGFGAFYLNDGKFNLATILSWLGIALGVTVGGIGVKGLLEIVGINLEAKKI